jgi:hypothetical protein
LFPFTYRSYSYPTFFMYKDQYIIIYLNEILRTLVPWRIGKRSDIFLGPNCNNILSELHEPVITHDFLTSAVHFNGVDFHFWIINSIGLFARKLLHVLFPTQRNSRITRASKILASGSSLASSPRNRKIIITYFFVLYKLHI